MTLTTAQYIIRQVHEKDYSYLMAWGLPAVRLAISTLNTRAHSTPEDIRLASAVSDIISRGHNHGYIFI